MDWGADAERIIAAVGNGPLPPLPFLENRPELAAHLAFEWRAFLELSTDRPVGFSGAGPIPWVAIDRYAVRYGVHDPDDFEAFLTRIRALDAAWLARQAEMQENPKGKG